ncbi:MAG: sugar ABC transporter ATP-binding protein [Armatimonadota bacterium]
MSSYNLQTIGVSKVYPGTIALNNVSLGFKGGEVHALIGKNGAGKSTLIKILSGAIQPSEGQILVEDKVVSLRSPRDSFNKGIATVYQELSLVPEMTVAENILLGRLPRAKKLGVSTINWEKVYSQAKEIMDSLNIDIDVRTKISKLGVAQQQVVEIAKAMSYNPAVLMLDEPTSALARDETESLFTLIRQLAQKGAAIIYISHRLHELPKIADVVSVLRDGNFVGTIPMSEATPKILTDMMFGEIALNTRPASLGSGYEPVLQVKNLTRRRKYENVNFTLYKGEVLGIAGMVGSGRTEVLRAISGADPFDSGEIIINGKSVKKPSPALMKKHGLCLTPENRKEEGLVQIMSTRDNICLAGMDRISLHGLIWEGRQRPIVEKTVSDLQIRVSNTDLNVSNLSGGNQQKVIVGNWLNTYPKIMLLDEPTRGIDVQAKQQIFKIMWDLSAQGISSIFVSSELEELIEVCHRILIMHNGHIIDEIRPDGLSLTRLFELCMEEQS